LKFSLIQKYKNNLQNPRKAFNFNVSKLKLLAAFTFKIQYFCLK